MIPCKLVIKFTNLKGFIELVINNTIASYFPSKALCVLISSILLSEELYFKTTFAATWGRGTTGGQKKILVSN